MLILPSAFSFLIYNWLLPVEIGNVLEDKVACCCINMLKNLALRCWAGLLSGACNA